MREPIHAHANLVVQVPSSRSQVPRLAQIIALSFLLLRRRMKNLESQGAQVFSKNQMSRFWSGQSAIIGLTSVPVNFIFKMATVTHAHAWLWSLVSFGSTVSCFFERTLLALVISPRLTVFKIIMDGNRNDQLLEQYVDVIYAIAMATIQRYCTQPVRAHTGWVEVGGQNRTGQQPSFQATT